jgi:tellurite resistance protein
MSDVHEEVAAYDAGAWKRFTRPQRVDKAIHMLEGIIKGVAADSKITKEEATCLQRWCSEHHDIRKKPPFDELLAKLDAALADGVLDEEEQKDILWFCRKLSTGNEYFDGVTSDLQRLQGMLIGIADDGVITKDELEQLAQWMEAHTDLKAAWPYDEIDSLLTAVLADGKIDPDEHKLLLEFCQEFLRKAPSVEHKQQVGDTLVVKGVCAVCPEITIKDHLFCFTGAATRPRSKMARLVEDRGGSVVKNMRRDVDYLIVGGKGNKAWAFSCYGRKVEEAVHLRKAGHPVQIVHEFDFWDELEDTGGVE